MIGITDVCDEGKLRHDVSMNVIHEPHGVTDGYKEISPLRGGAILGLLEKFVAEHLGFC